MLRFVALIALALAVVNMLPVPDMIGGRVLVTAMQILGRDISEERAKSIVAWTSLMTLLIPLIALVVVAVLAFTRGWVGLDELERMIRWAEENPRWTG
jgi:Zn-dependent protease